MKLNMRVFWFSLGLFSLRGLATGHGQIDIPELIGTFAGAAILAGAVAGVWTLCTRKKATK